MDTTKYLPEIPFPRRETFATQYFYQGGKLVCTVTNSPFAYDAAKSMFPGAVVETVFDQEAFDRARLEYTTEEARLTHQFKVDCFEAAGLKVNPFTGALWDLAWQRGHAGGLSDVYSIFMDVAVLDMLARRTYQQAT